jgi:DNA-binding transcriptional regulator GbsR (MarR family)
MLSMEKIADIASKLGKPEEVSVNALKRGVMMSIVELEGVAKRMEEKYNVTFEQFEQRDMLNKLGHSWEVEQDYYDWDRAVTELKKFREILKSLE